MNVFGKLFLTDKKCLYLRDKTTSAVKETVCHLEKVIAVKVLGESCLLNYNSTYIYYLFES